MRGLFFSGDIGGHVHAEPNFRILNGRSFNS